MRAWGKDDTGQLGNGSTTSAPATAPVTVTGLTGVLSITAGSQHALAVESDGSTWAWGNNLHGKLGVTTPLGSAPTPVKVTALPIAASVSAGSQHSVVALADGTLRSFGYNNHGQLGNGTTTDSTAPVTVSGLTAVTGKGGFQVANTYSADGLRETSNGASYTWQTNTAMPVVLNDATLSYVYDDAGLPVEQIDGSGTALYYQHDQYGSTRLLTNSTGVVVATYTYSPMGQLSTHTGTADTALRWNGQWQDTSSGLYNLRARYYDPLTANFLTRDPIEAVTGSAYGYADGNVLNSSDPSGLYSYDYREYLAPTSLIGSATSVMDYFKAHLADVFPFPVDGCAPVVVGTTCTLHPAPDWLKGTGQVTITDVSATSFTFTVTGDGYFDPIGATIMFSTCEADGNTYLEQRANADSGPLFDFTAPSFAGSTWQTQAHNLFNGILFGQKGEQRTQLDIILDWISIGY